MPVDLEAALEVGGIDPGRCAKPFCALACPEAIEPLAVIGTAQQAIGYQACGLLIFVGDRRSTEASCDDRHLWFRAHRFCGRARHHEACGKHRIRPRSQGGCDGPGAAGGPHYGNPTGEIVECANLGRRIAEIEVVRPATLYFATEKGAREVASRRPSLVECFSENDAIDAPSEKFGCGGECAECVNDDRRTCGCCGANEERSADDVRNRHHSRGYTTHRRFVDYKGMRATLVGVALRTWIEWR